MIEGPFFPYQNLATNLLEFLPQDCADGSHDLSHVHRVWINAKMIQSVEGGNLETLLAASILHDCVAVEKTHRCGLKPRRFQPPKPLRFWPI